MNTTELKAAESALEDALDKVRQLIASDPEPEPETKRKTKPVRGPLTVAQETGSYYWFVSGDGSVHNTQWGDKSLDRRSLARGNVFASRRDAEYKAAFDETWGQPIGEWEPDSVYWFTDLGHDTYCSTGVASAYSSIRRLWRKGEIGFGYAGKAELERRLAEQKKLDERFGL